MYRHAGSSQVQEVSSLVKEWQLSLACGLEGRVATKSTLLSDVQPFNLSELEAGQIWDKMKDTVANWRKYFADHGVTSSEIEELRHRFILAELLRKGVKSRFSSFVEKRGQVSL